MSMKYNRTVDVKSNILEISAETEKKTAWVKISVPEDFAQALMRDWLGAEERHENSIVNVDLKWKDVKGLTFAQAEISLRDMLKNDILERYDNEEYYDEHMIDEEASNVSLVENILNRYDNIQYWSIDVAREYIDNEYLSEADIELIRYLVADDEIAYILLSKKMEV